MANDARKLTKRLFRAAGRALAMYGMLWIQMPDNWLRDEIQRRRGEAEEKQLERLWNKSGTGHEKKNAPVNRQHTEQDGAVFNKVHVD